MHQQRFWHDACEHAWTLFSTSGGVCKLMALAAKLSLGVLARFTDIVPQLQFFGRVTTRFDILPKVDVSELQLCAVYGLSQHKCLHARATPPSVQRL